MTDSGGYRGEQEDDMKRRDIDHIIEDGPDPAFGALFAELRQADEIDPTIAASQIAAAAAIARDMPAVAPEAHTAPAPWYRRIAVRLAGLGLAAKILLGAAVAVAATGSAAAGGFLPDPVQTFISDTASHVGIHFPDPDDDGTTTTTTVADDGGAAAPASTTTTTEPDDGEGGIPTASAWETTTCDATPVSVHYSVTAEGDLQLDSVVGHPDDIDVDDDRIRVEFGGVRIDIRIDDEVTVDEDRDCDDPTTTTTIADGDDDDDDEDDGSTTTTTHADDEDDHDENDHDSPTTTTEPDDDDHDPDDD